MVQGCFFPDLIKTGKNRGTPGFRDGAAGSAQFYHPFGVAVDGEGNVLVADYNNHRVRRISPDGGAVSTLAGSGTRLSG